MRLTAASIFWSLVNLMIVGGGRAFGVGERARVG